MSIYQLVLASSSPRRRELLAWVGWNFTLQPVVVDETPLSGEIPALFVARLAKTKAHMAANGRHGYEVILGADTTVADGTCILGKPTDVQEARAMLTQLRAHSHDVFTALAAYLPDEGRWLFEDCRSRVPMRSYSDQEMEAYITSGDPLDKAGAYAIQHSGFHPVVDFQECYANVMGLPLCHLARMLRTLDFHPASEIPQLCEQNLGYTCPVGYDILQEKAA